MSKVNLLDRMRLFDRIICERRCTPADRSVAWALLWSFYNNGSGRCDPSVKAIAARVHLNHRHARRAIQHLSDLGYFRVDRLQGAVGKFGPTNAYVPLFDAQRTRGHKCHPVTNAPPLDQGAQMSPGDNDPHVPGGVDAPQTKEREPETLSRPSAEAIAMDFKTFWQVYPSRAPHSNPRKTAAERFAEVVRGGVPPATIIAGAERYAAHVAREGTDPRFIAQAANWLDQARWEDYHQPREIRPRAGMC